MTTIWHFETFGHAMFTITEHTTDDGEGIAVCQTCGARVLMPPPKRDDESFEEFHKRVEQWEESL